MTLESEQFDPATASDECLDWHRLSGVFFTSDEIYRADLDKVWRRGLLFARHDFEMPNAGDYTDNSVGTLRLRNVPNMWCHNSCDNAVSTRLLPVDKVTTEVSVIWLVDEKAKEGSHYDLEKLMPFW